MTVFFFFNDTATTEIYTLSLHDALPIFGWLAQRGETIFHSRGSTESLGGVLHEMLGRLRSGRSVGRSEEHTSELQSRLHLVCRLLLEKKKNKESEEQN